MKVVANREGYYGNAIRSVGESFEIKSKEELGSWMDIVGGQAPVEADPEVAPVGEAPIAHTEAHGSLSHLI